jgi:hypothetical protein
MIRLIDPSYFYGPLTVPDLGKQESYEKLLSSIEIYEKRFLNLFLGDDVKARLLNELIKPNPNSRWLEVLDMLIDTENKTSVIAKYIYRFHMENVVERGLPRMTPHVSKAWNEVADWVLDTRDWFIDFYLVNRFKDYFFIAWYYEGYQDEFKHITA